MSDKHGNNTGVAVPFVLLSGMVTALFVVLKVFGIITWSWWWVLSPVWLPVIIFIAAVIIGLVIMMIKEKRK